MSKPPATKHAGDASESRSWLGSLAGRRRQSADGSGAAATVESRSAEPRKHRPIVIPHAEEGEYGEDGLNYLGHMVAGSTAGMSEHVFMYPADTVKTRMQADAGRRQPQYRGVFHAMGTILRTEGLAGLYRGVPAVMMGAVPGHALHFSVYEGMKNRLGGSHTVQGREKSEGATAVADMIAGAAATMVHDGISTPVDVVKQRMQLFGQEGYRGSVFSVASQIWRAEGLRAFYVSYPTTLAMNIPVFAVYFASYEGVKRRMRPILAYEQRPGAEEVFSPQVHSVAGGCAGALAAICSNPLDVVKTRLQTQTIAASGGARQVVRDLLVREGAGAFMKGVAARILYQSPGAAVCWVTYEYMKHVLDLSMFGDTFLDDHHDHDHDHGQGRGHDH